MPLGIGDNTRQEPLHGEEDSIEKVPEDQNQTPVKEVAKKTAKIASKPETPALPDRPTNEEARQDRLKTLKEKLKSLGESK